MAQSLRATLRRRLLPATTLRNCRRPFAPTSHNFSSNTIGVPMPDIFDLSVSSFHLIPSSKDQTSSLDLGLFVGSPSITPPPIIQMRFLNTTVLRDVARTPRPSSRQLSSIAPRPTNSKRRCNNFCRQNRRAAKSCRRKPSRRKKLCWEALTVRQPFPNA